MVTSSSTELFLTKQSLLSVKNKNKIKQ
jgi:hypothetical protein